MKRNKKHTLLRGIGFFAILLIFALSITACKHSPLKPIQGPEEEEPTPTVSPTEIPSTTEGPTSTATPTPTTEPTMITTPTPTTEPTATEPTKPTATTAPTPTEKPEPKPTAKPAPSTEQDTVAEAMKSFVPSNEVISGMTAIAQGDYIFYKTGTLSNTVIEAKNIKSSKATELVSYNISDFNIGEFFLKGSQIYYHSDGDIYRIGVNGRDNVRLYKGTATILGFYQEDVIAIDKKSRELIRINKDGSSTSIVKLKSIDSLEAVMLEDGLYYINKSSNNTLKGNDPIDRLFYIDFNGNNKKEIHAELSIYDLKSNGTELFFLAYSEEPAKIRVHKVKDQGVTLLHSFTKEELEAEAKESIFMDEFIFTLLAVDSTHVYYGINFNNGKNMNIYRIGINGKTHGFFMNIYDIEGINKSAYFRSGMMDEGYLRIVLDCDEDPVEVYYIDLQSKSAVGFEGGYYISSSIDVEGDMVFYCKSPEYDRYGEMLGSYEYGMNKFDK